MKFLYNLLMKKNEGNRKPYGYSASKAMQDFKNNADVIIDEWRNYVSATHSVGTPIDEISAYQSELNQDKKWKAFFVYVYGYINPEARIYFPETIRLAEKWQPEVRLVFFSNLEPQKHIQPHTGNNHSVIRTQIGIDIPEPEKTGLRVADKTIHLQEKDIFTFDDTFEHEAWNHSEKVRTVLIIDNEKEFPHIYRLINRYFLNQLKKSTRVQSVVEKLI